MRYIYKKINKISKASYYQRKLKLFEGGIKKTWTIIKELIVHEVEITYMKTIAKRFNNFFVKISPNLALKILKNDTNYKEITEEIQNYKKTF